MTYQEFMNGIAAPEVFHHFYNLSQVPRCSGNYEPICTFLADFAKGLGLRYEIDEAHNVIIWKPASPDRTDRPPVMMTAHTDMVCVKTNDSDHDFSKDPLCLIREGDIILAGGRPKCVIKADGDLVTAVSYEDAAVEQILPERHMLMGDAVFYGKIVSMFGRNGSSGRKGMNRIMKYMVMSEMLKGNGAGGKTPANPMGQAMLAMMMMGGKGEDMFDELFSFDGENEDADDTEN